MPITPSNDKKAFWKRIRYDTVIIKSMGWSKFKDCDFIKYILLKRAFPEILKSDCKYICIYNVPCRKTQSIRFSDTVIQIDILVPSNDSDSADKAMEQIINICSNNFKVNNRHVMFDTLLGDTTAPTGFYCNSVRFYYYSSV